MKLGVPRTPRIPDDSRLVELMTEGIENWYALHVVESMECYCGVYGPDLTCELGHALQRLSLSARAGTLDAHKGESV